METKLVRIAQIAKERPKEVFTSLYHHLNEEMLTQAHRELKGDKASGVDRITKANYTENLKVNIHHLVEAVQYHGFVKESVKLPAGIVETDAQLREGLSKSGYKIPNVDFRSNFVLFVLSV